MHSLTARLIVWVLGATAMVSLVTFFVAFTDNRATLEANARQRAELAAEALVSDIAGLLRGIEQETLTLAAVVGHVRPDADQTRALLASLLESDASVFGAGIWYAPGAYVAGTDFAAYLYRDGTRIEVVDGVVQLPGFRNESWYRVPALTGKRGWTEPYRDAGLSGVDMVTYSLPVYEQVDGVRRLLAVVSTDIRLGSQKQRIRAMIDRLDPNLSIIILSREGRLIALENIDTLLEELPRDTSGTFTLPFPQLMANEGREDLRGVAERMMRGDRGSEVLVGWRNDVRLFMHFLPLPTTDWSIGVISEDAERRREVAESERRQLWLFALNLVLVTLVIVLVARRMTGPLRALAVTAREIGHDPMLAEVPTIATRDEVADLGDALRRMQVDLGTYLEQLKTTLDAKQRLEGELSAARQIQMAMLPRLPEHGRLVDGCDAAATLIPAKAVGGDLFDLIPLADGRLMFLVGDVSDKGAAAALFMAKTVTLANLLGRERFGPGELIDRLNRELCRDNDACMFVTALCGVLDPESGEVTFTNAGHNPPLRFGSDNQARYVEVPAGTALGIFEEAQFQEARLVLAPGEALLLYTDGVTEAVDADLEPFGEARLEALPLGLFDTARATVEAVVVAVEAFAGEAEQADDITVLALRRTAPLPCADAWRMRGGIEAVAEAQAWLGATLRRAGVDATLAGELELVAEEVLANVVHHAHHDREDTEALVEVEIDTDRVRLRFSDAGPPFNPLVEAPEPDLETPPEAREIGGLGLVLVRRLADALAYRYAEGRNVLEVEKHRA